MPSPFSPCLTLSKWLLETTDPRAKTDPSQEAFFLLLERVASQNASLRADQIVALCRLLEIDVARLVQGHGVRSRTGSAAEGSKDLMVELRSTARRWANEGGVPYQFDRMSHAPPPRATGARINFVMLQPADGADEELASYTPYVTLEFDLRKPGRNCNSARRRL
jgi:hypothetical protein